MGMFGRGIAFGQQFMPRPAIRFRGGPMMPRGGPISFNYHENITVQQGPTGFWGFMSGFMPSFLNTFAMFGMMNNSFGLGGGCFGHAQGITGGAASTDSKNAKNLADLEKLFKAKDVTIVERDGKFTATDKNGNLIGSDLSFDEMSKKLSEYNSNSKPSVETDTPTKTEAQLKADKAKEMGLELKDGKYMKDGKEYEWDSASKTFKVKPEVNPDENPNENPNENDGNEHSGSIQSSQSQGSGHRARVSSRSQGAVSHGVKVPKGWYKAPTGGDGQSMIQKGTLRAGMSAKQVTDIILNNKVNYLSAADRNQLAAEVEKYNPSIFKNGKVVEGADLNKLDLPSINYIKNKYVASRNVTAHNGTGDYTDKHGKTNTVSQTVTSPTGRYAKKENGAWRYYAKDGTELKASHIQKNDKNLWNKTHPAKTQSSLTMTDRNSYNGNGYGA